MYTVVSWNVWLVVVVTGHTADSLYDLHIRLNWEGLIKLNYEQVVNPERWLAALEMFSLSHSKDCRW